MTGAVMARLFGGPFDGDEGGVVLPVPEALWVCACPHGAACRYDGIHWSRAVEPNSVLYQRGRVSGGVQMYVYRDLGLQSRDKRSELVPAEELAHAA